MGKLKKRKLSNRGIILEYIFRNAPVARTEIAGETEITPATVTANVAALISEGAVREVGEVTAEDGVSGRKRVLIDMEAGFAWAVGVEFTQKALVVCAVNLKGEVLACLEYPFTQELAERITQWVIEAVGKLLEDPMIRERAIGIGIAVPGHMNQEQTRLITNRRTWDSFNPAAVGNAFDLPVVFENNARCMAFGEYLFHPKNTPDSFAFFHVGMGMFCANVVEGELFLGNGYVAGEIGHTIVCPEGRLCECGKRGCLQTYSSENWILKNCRLLYENSPDTLLRHLTDRPEALTISHVAAAYSMGDHGVGFYISEALKYMGIMVSNIAIIMNPGKIFLHGQIFENEDIRRELTDYIERQLLFVDSNYHDNIEILPYEARDGAVGAAALALERFFIS